MAVTETGGLAFSMGRVARNTFGVIARNPLTMLIVALLYGVPTFVLAITNYEAAFATANPDAGFDGGALVINGLWFIVYTVMALILQAAIVSATIRDLNCQPVRAGEALSIGARHAIPIILIGIVAYLGIVLGLILLIIPGIILALMWSVAVPARVVENTGILESLGRSRELTKGYRWPILGLVIIYFILNIAISLPLIPFQFQLAASVLDGSVTTVSLLTFYTASVLLAMIQVVIGSAGIAVLYFELRLIKEGIGPEALASVFD